eukprot:CAMPEP_0170631250 /NCGR_PEP_ID=MMETSP0224-20130122/34513_1 /TAXON_ID=285029 /ORGANISM="Togula jolla, Strain CCCM 725" /LENGTH=53 /DNA_ID=CAMNT_0010959521 /DNA_START=706 /DNA_END=863 /DNA_ORIENTATION=+
MSSPSASSELPAPGCGPWTANSEPEWGSSTSPSIRAAAALAFSSFSSFSAFSS